MEPAASDRDAARPYVKQKISERGDGPVIASTDYMKLYADQVRPSVPNRYSVLGTDGFGRSDYRRTLRYFFEVDRHFVTVAASRLSPTRTKFRRSRSRRRFAKYGIDPDKANPAHS